MAKRPEITGAGSRLIYPVRIMVGDRALPAGEVEAIIQQAIMRYTKRKDEG